MRHPKRVFATVAIVFCGLIITACPSFLKALQILELKDSSGTVVGKMGGTAIHYPKDADKDFADDHYAIVISNASVDGSISDEEFAKIDSIGIKDKDSGAIITGDSYMCDKSTDIKNNGFGCRFLASKVGASNKVTLTLMLKDKTSWNSNEIDLGKFVESSELSSDAEAVITSIGSGNAQMYTLKTCSDASGNKADVKTAEDCPAGMTSGTVTTPPPTTSTATDANKDCVPPNFLNNDGKCISILQPQKQCDANSFILLDGTCGTDCGANQVQKQGACQCATGYMKDANTKDCKTDPSYSANMPPAASSGGGSCSLIRVK